MCSCEKETNRSGAAGNLSPETFISHYPERETAGERQTERERERGKMDRSKDERGVKTKELKNKD